MQISMPLEFRRACMKKNILTGIYCFAIFSSVYCQDLRIEGNITIENGGVLAIEGNTSRVSGIISNQGVIRFQGSNSKNFDANNQSISGSLDFSAGVTTLTGKLRIPGGDNSGTIDISGTGSLNTGGKLTLIADSSGKVGRIAAISSSANPSLTSSGDSIILMTTRGISSFRFFGNPFKTQLPLSQLMNDAFDIDITGPGGTSNGFSVNTSDNYAAVLKYDEPTNKWKPCLNGYDSIKVGYGASIYVQNRKGQTISTTGATYPEAALISIYGDLRSGTVKTVLSNTAAGWNLVANPYPSNIDISETAISSGWNNAFASVHMYDKKNKSFIAYNRSNNQGTGNMKNVIPMGGAFLVQAAGSANSAADITFTESIKVSTKPSANDNNPLFLIIDSLQNRFGISIINKNSKELEEDQCVFLFGNDLQSTDNFDVMYDARDLRSAIVNIGIISNDDSKLAISSHPWNLNRYIGKTFPLTIWTKETGNYTIKYNEIATVDSTVEILLKDNYLTKFHPIGNAEYNFQINTDSKSTGDERFELIFAQSAVGIKNKLQEELGIILPNPLKQSQNLSVVIPPNIQGVATVIISDLTGKILHRQEIDQQDMQSGAFVVEMKNLIPNCYILSFQSTSVCFSKKVIVTP